MTLVIGGSSQGKSAYAMHLYKHATPTILDGSLCNTNDTINCDILDHLHLYMHRLLKDGQSAESIVLQLKEAYHANPNLIIVCNELGSGVVPMNTFDRLYRETVGRICCQLALDATHVYRITCGIPLTLK